jgi:hypothetical protein
MGNKVGIFTTNSVDKIHPRIAMQEEVLTKAGYSVEIIRSTSRREGFLNEILNWFSLKYFKKGFIRANKSKVAQFDIVHVYDFQLLPLSIYAKRLGKKVIYETLDDNVHLHFHALQKKLPFLSLIRNSVISRMSRYERETAESYCSEVIVNSENLLENFESAELIYYASPLEGLRVTSYDTDKDTAFMYVGKLTEAKGASLYREILEKHRIPMIIMGKAFDNVSKELCSSKGVKYLGNFNSEELREEVEKLIAGYNLIGLSIIIPENKSYELQEANKDIDYMAMGVPFIGNERVPTMKKINKGAGVLYNDDSRVEQLIQNLGGLYDACSASGMKQYQDFSFEQFEKKLLDIYK